MKNAQRKRRRKRKRKRRRRECRARPSLPSWRKLNWDNIRSRLAFAPHGAKLTASSYGRLRQATASRLSHNVRKTSSEVWCNFYKDRACQSFLRETPFFEVASTARESYQQYFSGLPQRDKAKLTDILKLVEMEVVCDFYDTRTTGTKDISILLFLCILASPN
jgi:hypothetical protein